MKPTSLFALSSAFAALSLSAHGALVAHYKFEEISGTTLVDSSGNGYNGSRVGTGGSLNVAGTVGSAYQPGPSDSYGTVGAGVTNFGIGGNNARTISLWFNTSSFGTSTSGSQHRLIGMGSGAAAVFDIVAENSELKNRVGIRYGNGNAFYDANNTGTGFSTNTWYHLAVVYDGTTLDLESINTASDGVGLSFYVNGSLVNTVFGNLNNGGQALNTSATDFFFGANPLVSETAYPGLLDDVQVYNEALTGSQVLSLYSNPGTVIPEPGAALLGGLGLLALLRRRR